jgi:Ca-activated chloride channel family protein
MKYQTQVDLLDYGEYTEANGFIPRLWASRKIGYLLNQIRYQGENQEWVDAVIELSLRYGIITPYTSFLVVENDLFTEEGWDQAAEEIREYSSGPAVGADAVEKAEAESNLRSAESVPQPALPNQSYDGISVEPVLKYVGEKTFYLRDGTWVDSLYDGSKMDPIRIGFGDDVYFELLETRPEWGKYLALGESVIFVIDGQAYQIDPGEDGVTRLPSGLRGEQFNSRDEGSMSRKLPSLCSLPLLVGLALLGLAKGLI